MKNLIMIIAIMVTSVAIFAQKDKDNFTIKVDGLGCPFCAYGLEKKFKEFENIKKVSIEMETGVFTFQYPTADSLELVAVEEQVEAAGYTPVHTKIERSYGKVETSNAEIKVAISDIDSTELNIDSFVVAGNCGMCKARIEKVAGSVDGVISAIWDVETDMLNLQYNESTTSAEEVKEAIANAGHDTNNFKAAEEVYNNLPGCCQYDRIK